MSDLGFSLTFGVCRAGDDGADTSRIEPSSVALASAATPASESMATYNSSGCPVPSNGLMAGGGSRVPALGVSGSLLMAFQAFRLCPDDDPGSLRSEPGAAGDSGSWDKRGLALAFSLALISFSGVAFGIAFGDGGLVPAAAAASKSLAPSTTA